ncbi:UNVERIFIED_CONTAM: hypothetical protein GTU68_029923, partial [Idotea baltica]|nr:hypothetical protein [Idotea baltica]
AEEPAETEVAAAETEEPAAPAAVASIDGDATKGKKVFRKCKACHTIGEGAKNKVGPNLTDIIGRTFGAVEDFKYSKVFNEANAAGRVWTPEELDAFLKKPKSFIKGTKMAFTGLRKDDQRADVIAYLASNGE